MWAEQFTEDGDATPHRAGSARMSRRLNGLERELDSAHRGNPARTRPARGGAASLLHDPSGRRSLSGVPIVEFLPIAIFEGLVMAGLLIACMMPASDRLRGDRGPDPDPAPTPPPADPVLSGCAYSPTSNLAPRATPTNGSREILPARHADIIGARLRRRARVTLGRRMPRVLTRIVISFVIAVTIVLIAAVAIAKLVSHGPA